MALLLFVDPLPHVNIGLANLVEELILIGFVIYSVLLFIVSLVVLLVSDTKKRSETPQKKRDLYFGLKLTCFGAIFLLILTINYW